MPGSTNAALAAVESCDLEECLARFGQDDGLTLEEALAAGFKPRQIIEAAGTNGYLDQCVRFAELCAKAVEASSQELSRKFSKALLRRARTEYDRKETDEVLVFHRTRDVTDAASSAAFVVSQIEDIDIDLVAILREAFT